MIGGMQLLLFLHIQIWIYILLLLHGMYLYSIF